MRVNTQKQVIWIVTAFACISAVLASCKKDNTTSGNGGKVIIYTDRQQFVPIGYYLGGITFIAISVDGNNSSSNYHSIYDEVASSGNKDDFPYNDACSTSTSSLSVFCVTGLTPGQHAMRVDYNYYDYYDGNSTVLTDTMTFKIDANNCTYIDLPEYFQ